MNTIKLLLTTAALCIALPLFAEDNELRSADPDVIFNSIMQTMPGEMRSRIDSAAVQRGATGTSGSVEAPFTTTRQPAADRGAKEASIEKLPEAVREQVRKTMLELEAEQRERVVEFKESRRVQKGR